MNAKLLSSSDFDEITPHDTNLLSNVTRGIYVGTGGDVAVVSIRGTTAVFANVPDGSVLEIRARQILATGTTATDLVALW